MTIALALLLAQGILGAADTLWYHEWQQHLAGRPTARKELLLHASRDFAYAAIFGSLAWVTWNGLWAIAFGLLLLFEIVITLNDFIEEDRSRPLPPGERVMHTIMAIIYGAFLAYLIPEAIDWWAQPTGFGSVQYGWISWVMTLFAVGVFGSGIRDLRASYGVPPAANSSVQ